MVRLRSSDLEQVARFSAELAAAEESEAFPARLLESLRGLIGSDSLSYCELDRVREQVLGGAFVGDDSGDEPADEVFWALRHQWPTCSYEDRTLDFSPHKLSDFITTRQLQRLQIYNDYLRPTGVEHEISVGLPAELTHTKLFIFVNGRGRRDFGERERTILTLLRAHLVQRYEAGRLRRRAQAALTALEATDEPLVLLDEGGRAEFATARARRLLSNYGLDLDDLPDTGPLIARAIRHDLLLLEERKPFGLTTREREILALVADGHTNAEIARSLWISPATVRKHLEHAYIKLGVTNRTAATRLVREHERPDLAVSSRSRVAHGDGRYANARIEGESSEAT